MEDCTIRKIFRDGNVFVFQLKVVKVGFRFSTSDNSDWSPGVFPISTGLEVLTNLESYHVEL